MTSVTLPDGSRLGQPFPAEPGRPLWQPRDLDCFLRALRGGKQDTFFMLGLRRMFNSSYGPALSDDDLFHKAAYALLGGQLVWELPPPIVIGSAGGGSSAPSEKSSSPPPSKSPSAPPPKSPPPPSPKPGSPPPPKSAPPPKPASPTPPPPSGGGPAGGGAGGAKPEPVFTWKWHTKKGEVELIGVRTKEFVYQKKSEAKYKEERSEFASTLREKWLKSLAGDPEKVKAMNRAGIPPEDIKNMQEGISPPGWQVHHRMPLDDNGTNEPSNFVLTRNEPAHQVFTAAQIVQTSNPPKLERGQSRKVKLPVPEGWIYPPVPSKVVERA